MEAPVAPFKLHREGMHGPCRMHSAPRRDPKADAVSCPQAILMNKDDTTRVRLVFANQTEEDILLR